MAILGIRKRIKGFIKDVFGLSGPPSEPSSYDFSASKTTEQRTEPTETVKTSPFDPSNNNPISQESSSDNQDDVKVESPKNIQQENIQQENIQQENIQQENSITNTKQATNSDFTFAQVEEVLDDMIRPALQNDGGDITLVDIKDNCIYVQLRGACGTCPSSTATMQFGVKNLLNEEFPSMVHLYDITSGTPIAVEDPTMM